MGTSIGDARPSTRSQSTDYQTEDPVVTSLQRDVLYVDSGVTGTRTLGPQLNRAPSVLHGGDVVPITIFGCLRTPSITVLTLADDLKPLRTLWVLNKGINVGSAPRDVVGHPHEPVALGRVVPTEREQDVAVEVSEESAPRPRSTGAMDTVISSTRPAERNDWMVRPPST